MAFIQEDGTGVAGANAFISVAFLKGYHSDRGNAVTAGTSTIEDAIVRATDYMFARWGFVGTKKTAAQGLHFPASKGRYKDGSSVPDYPIEPQQSCADYALVELNTPGKLAPAPTYDDSGANVTLFREKVGPIEEETQFGGSGVKRTYRKYPVPDGRLKRVGLVTNDGRLWRI